MRPTTFYIQWDRGHMTISADLFFPASKTNLRKLLKGVDMDFDHRKQIRRGMADYCTTTAAEKEASLRSLANRSADCATVAKELLPEIEKQEQAVQRIANYVRAFCKRDPNAYRDQLKEQKDTLRELKKKQRTQEQWSRRYASDFKRTESQVRRLRENAEVIELWNS